MATEKTHKPKSDKSDLNNQDDQTRNGHPKTTVWRPIFLQVFAATGNVAKAAKAACVRPSAAYYARNTCQEFAGAWIQAELDARFHLEGKVYEDAENNPENAKWILSRRFPDVWGEKRTVSVSGSGKDGEIVHEHRITGVEISNLIGEDDESDPDS